ncbi:MAG TPA: flavodoxin family protein [Dehalococcoidia bacterium]|nr:flavodoxin family protein [Dehalococcoidia bacterium]
MSNFPIDEQPVRIVIAYHSGFGHTARQAAAVARGAASVPGTAIALCDVGELTDDLWAALDDADAIIFGTPTYMGSPSAVFKAFAEATARAWADNLRWKDKIAAGFTNSQGLSGDKLNSLIDLAILAAQHGMHWVSLDLYPGWNTTAGSIDDLNRLGSWLGAMAQSHGDEGPEVAPRASDLETAAHLGQRVATVTKRWVQGRTPAAAGTAAEPEAVHAVATAG